MRYRSFNYSSSYTVADQRWSSKPNFHSDITKVTTPASLDTIESILIMDLLLHFPCDKNKTDAPLKPIFADCDTAQESDGVHAIS